jgi:hypothetical protein
VGAGETVVDADALGEHVERGQAVALAGHLNSTHRGGHPELLG